MIRTVLCLAAAALFAVTAWTFGEVQTTAGWVVDGFGDDAAIRLVDAMPRLLAAASLLSAAAADWAWVAKTFRG